MDRKISYKNERIILLEKELQETRESLNSITMKHEALLDYIGSDKGKIQSRSKIDNKVQLNPNYFGDQK